MIDKVCQLMAAYGNGETACGMHHIHANRQDAGTGPSNWHQDYHSAPDTYLREQLMIHVFYYLNGLDGQIGDLMVLPRSQYAHWDGGTMQALFKDNVLPGSKTFGTGNPVPPGTAIICHSALVHGRRQRPGGEGKPRYFLDVSCASELPPSIPANIPVILCSLRLLCRQTASRGSACGRTTWIARSPSVRWRRALAWTATASTIMSGTTPSSSRATSCRGPPPALACLGLGL